MTAPINKEPLQILLAEDNDDDILITKQVFRTIDSDSQLHVVRDGVAALDYLYQRNTYADKEAYPTPHILLLDIKMPRKNGLEVLQALQKDKTFERVRTILLSSSANQKDIQKSYAYGACAYIRKPLSFGEFETCMQQMLQFWKGVTFPETSSLS